MRIALLALLLVPAFLLENRVTPDWPAFYAGAAARSSAELYSFEASQRVTSQFEDPRWVWAFVRPPIYAAILRPLAWFRPHTAWILWQLLNLGAVLGFVCFVGADRVAVFTTVAMVPLWKSFQQGQDIPIALLILGAAIWLYRGNRPLAAGLVLGLCLIKWTVFLPVGAVLLCRRDGKLAAGLAVSLGVLLGACFALYGLAWPAQYLECLRENQRHLASVHFYSYDLALALPLLIPLFRFLLAPAEHLRTRSFLDARWRWLPE